MLSGLPLSIGAVEGKKQSDILVGLYDGSIEVIRGLQPENRYKVESVINGPVENITTIKGKPTVILTHNNAVAIYTI